MSAETSESKVSVLDDTRMIRQSNRLIEARYRLTLYEQRMIIAICSQLDCNASEFSTVKIRVADMAKFCNFERKKSYEYVKSTIMKLLTRVLQIKESDGGWYVTHWLQSAKYIPSESVIEYKVDEQLKPQLLQLKSAYLSTPAAPMMTFASDYSIRIYFILKKALKLREVEYEIDFFRDRFELGKAYLQISNFKDRIMEPAMKEINEKSDIKVEHTYIKEGRTIKRIKFIIENKSVQINNSPPQLSAPNTVDEENNLSKEEKEIFARITNPDKWNIESDMAKNLITYYGVERVKRNLIYCDKHRTGKHNLGGFLVEMIRKDAAEDEKQRKEEKKREDEKQKRRNESVLKEILDMNGGADANVTENSENNVLTGFPKDKIAELKERIGAAK